MLRRGRDGCGRALAGVVILSDGGATDQESPRADTAAPVHV